MAKKKDNPVIPIEVDLVKGVRSCRTCKWFWGGTPPYGDFPVFDWQEEFPEKIRNQQQTTNPYQKPKPGPPGLSCGTGQVDPGIMHGCRKAPIMTIGINPNMTSYFPSESGARWSYPNFSHEASYAYYYRYHNVYQESLDINFIKKCIIPEGTMEDGKEVQDRIIIAKKDGKLTSAKRSSDHRWMLLSLEYSDNTKEEIEVAWTDEIRFVVFIERFRNSFKKGDIIGGKIQVPVGKKIKTFENVTGYYQRYVNVLERFEKVLPKGHEPLSISEDVAQHDMIGCASPGWSSAYDIPTGRITQNCVIDNAWLIKQLVQSKPAVIVLVGGSSLSMFGRIFKPFMDLKYEYGEEGNEQMRETFQLFRQTVDNEHYLEIKLPRYNYHLKTRIVLSPHFSYSANFITQSRFTSDAWTAFTRDFEPDYEVLKTLKYNGRDRIQSNTWNDMTPILVDKAYDSDRSNADSLINKLSVSAYQVVMAYYYDPIEMLTEVLRQEYDAGRIAYSKEFKRLERPEGACHFCNNALWQFPGGCAYKKDKGAPIPAKETQKIVSAIIRQSQKSLELEADALVEPTADTDS